MPLKQKRGFGWVWLCGMLVVIKWPWVVPCGYDGPMFIKERRPLWVSIMVLANSVYECPNGNSGL